MKTIPGVAKRIKNLEIQGASNIATHAVKAICRELREFSGSKEEMHILFREAKRMLIESRATEPMMRNGLKYIEKKLIIQDTASLEGFKEMVTRIEEDTLAMFTSSRVRIIEIGNKRIMEGDVILTHCHSSAVSETLLQAHKEGVKFKVINTETRPRYQGRITSTELVSAGIDTTMIVDSAARYYMKEVDYVLVGCDAVTSEGNVINKIGTSQVAQAASEARVPFYVMGTLLKFDPVTLDGHFETIEERSPDEIWVNPPKGLKIRNPAFDVTKRDYVHGLITEGGIISPHSVLEAIHREYPWMLL